MKGALKTIEGNLNDAAHDELNNGFEKTIKWEIMMKNAKKFEKELFNGKPMDRKQQKSILESIKTVRTVVLMEETTKEDV